ncbi:hypothetical protein HY489_01185 [Candidatus Woesearchaeota archaeon]|nr:hypothetical protein [Candidatus Woesearchaeota archaeon]
MKNRPIAELTLRRYEKPYKLQGRDLVKKLCLSLGLLQPEDSRDVIVDVFLSLLNAQKPVTQQELQHAVKTTREQHQLTTTGCTASNIRRQLRRLKEHSLVQKSGNTHHLPEKQLHNIFEEQVEKLYLPAIITRVKEYCAAVEQYRGGNK